MNYLEKIFKLKKRKKMMKEFLKKLETFFENVKKYI